MTNSNKDAKVPMPPIIRHAPGNLATGGRQAAMITPATHTATDLIAAIVRKDDKEAIRIIEAGGFDLDEKCWIDEPPLQELAITLPDKRGQFAALHIAAAFGRPEVIKALLKKGADANLTSKKGPPLAIAMDHFQTAAFGALIKEGGDAIEINSPSLLIYAAKHDDAESIRILMKLGAPYDTTQKSNAPLATAAVAGGFNAVKELLAHRTLEQINEELPLHCMLMSTAALPSHTDIGELLIDSGIDIHAKDDIESILLHYAYKNPRIAAKLLDKGADPNAPNRYGITPLHSLVKHIQTGKQKALLDYLHHGGDLNEVDHNHISVLYDAIRNLDPDDKFIQLLLEYGADRFAICPDGCSIPDHYRQLTRRRNEALAAQTYEGTPLPEIDWNHLSNEATTFLEFPRNCASQLLQDGKPTRLLLELCGAHKLHEVFAPKHWQHRIPDALQLIKEIHAALPPYWQARYTAIKPDIPSLIHTKSGSPQVGR